MKNNSEKAYDYFIDRLSELIIQYGIQDANVHNQEEQTLKNRKKDD